jgi:hypothetical protein
MVAEFIPLSCPYNELVIDVATIPNALLERLYRRLERRRKFAELGSIVLGYLPAAPGPCTKIRDFLE